MATDHFCLKWNNFHNSILSAFESLQSSEDLVDVTLMCEGRNVKAHKVILSACSPYFRNLFKETPCQHPIIILKNVLHCDIIAILQFMYQGEVLISQDGLSSFLKTAELLQVSGLAGNTPVTNSLDDNVEDDAIIPPKCSVPSPPLVPIAAASPTIKTTPTKKVDPITPKKAEKENVRKEEKLLPRVEPVEEPIQSCSYQSPEGVIVKTESENQDFEDMEYSLMDQENSEHPESASEEQSILERSLKSQGEQRRRTVQKNSEPVNCSFCTSLVSRAYDLKRHYSSCKVLKRLSIGTEKSAVKRKFEAMDGSKLQRPHTSMQIRPPSPEVKRRTTRSRRKSVGSLDESYFSEQKSPTQKEKVTRQKSTASPLEVPGFLKRKLEVLSDLTVPKPQNSPLDQISNFEEDSSTPKNQNMSGGKPTKRTSRLQSAKKRSDEFEYY